MEMKWLFAGGGTGGHLFPAIAMAEEVMTRHPENEVLFVGTARGLEARVVPEVGYRLELIDVAPLKGKGLAARIRKGAGRWAKAAEFIRCGLGALVLLPGGARSGHLGYGLQDARPGSLAGR